MIKNFWQLLQITMMVLTILTTYSSILALRSNSGYCSGQYCSTSSDCNTGCACNGSTNQCHEIEQSPVGVS